MKKSERLHQGGGTTLTVLVVIIIFVIGALIYVLLMQSGKRPQKTAPVIDVDVEQTMPQKSKPSERSENYPFDDGLKNPVSTTGYPLDEFGEGLAQTDVFNIDINADGRKDRISRSRYENGTDHFYYDYTIELNASDAYINITPDSFRTTEGAECALQKLRFQFHPSFEVIKITRPWEESWTTPTGAIKIVYKLVNNDLKEISRTPLKEICNVSDLF